jgi:hypothetical protein
MAATLFLHLIQAVLAARDSLRIAIQLMTALEIALDNRLNYLLALYTHVQDMETYMKNIIEETAVTLNLRGTLFVVDTKYLDSIFFHALIYSDPAPIRGHYFIDRPIEGFDYYLGLLLQLFIVVIKNLSSVAKTDIGDDGDY